MPRSRRRKPLFLHREPAPAKPKSTRPSTDLRHLWLLRILIPLRGHKWLLGVEDCFASEEVADFLRLPPLNSKDDVAGLHTLLREAWVRAEARSGEFRLRNPFAANLDKACGLYGFNSVERQIVALAISASFDPLLEAPVNEVPLLSRQSHEAWARILGLPAAAVRKALSHGGRIATSGLFQVEGSLMHTTTTLQVNRPELIGICTEKNWSVHRLIAGMAREAPPPELGPSDYPHVASELGLMTRYLRQSLARRRKGVNILLHGAPGAGKTQLARLLGQQTGTPVFEIDSADAEGDASSGTHRLGMLATSQKVLANRRALVVFDEIDQVIADGNWFTGVRTTADRMRGWLTHHLETNPVPTVWIANNVRSLDPAFSRRFDIVLEMKLPPRQQRSEMIRRHAGDWLDDAQVRRLAQVETLSPATLRRAVRVIRGAAVRPHAAGAAMEQLISQSLRLQSRQPDKDPIPPLPSGHYDPSLSHASSDLCALADGLARSREGRLCLYGPPGTGKSAFGLWLGDRIGRPVLVRRASDLLGPYVGETEARIARAFRDASADEAILQIDEVDGFLRDRQSARASWEASLVNEMLTQMESFRGIFIASTNLMSGLDPAAMRRFDAKILFGFLRPEQAWRLFDDFLVRAGLPAAAPDAELRQALSSLQCLTPGDFAAVARRQRFEPVQSGAELVAALAAECRHKPGERTRRMGFV